jgi:hypothetical protein
VKNSVPRARGAMCFIASRAVRKPAKHAISQALKYFCAVVSTSLK